MVFDIFFRFPLFLFQTETKSVLSAVTISFLLGQIQMIDFVFLKVYFSVLLTVNTGEGKDKPGKLQLMVGPLTPEGLTRKKKKFTILYWIKTSGNFSREVKLGNFWNWKLETSNENRNFRRINLILVIYTNTYKHEYKLFADMLQTNMNFKVDFILNLFVSLTLSVWVITSQV